MRQPGNPLHAAREGLTFLEVVLGVVLLGLVSTTLGTLASTLDLSRERQSLQLGAAELANRLIIIRMNDKKQLPSPTLPLEYGGELYRWSIEETDVDVALSQAASTSARRGSNVGIDNLKLIRVDVWLGEDSGGSYRDVPGVPRYTLTRLIDGLLPKNPTALQILLENEEGREQLLNDLLNEAEGR